MDSCLPFPGKLISGNVRESVIELGNDGFMPFPGKLISGKVRESFIELRETMDSRLSFHGKLISLEI